jgi:RNA polymerase sigma-70 factor (ECF subfamily)
MRSETKHRSATGESEAKFVDIYRRHHKPIQAYCARRTPASQVDDAVAETFLVAWRRLDDVPEGAATLPWLYGVAYRVLSRQWRHKARSRRLIERVRGLAGEESTSPEVFFVRSTEYREVLIACSRLHPVDQEVLRLTVWEELSYADVAVVLGIAVGAVRQRLYRARRNLTAEYNRMTLDRQPPAAPNGGGS